MIRDQRVHYTLAPLVLRLALAAIFIFHGYHKVFDPDTELGATWAAKQWGPQSKMPPGLMERVDQIPDKKLDAEMKTEVKADLATSYAREVPPMPTRCSGTGPSTRSPGASCWAASPCCSAS